MTIRTIIIDDEPSGILILSLLLEKYFPTLIEIVGTTESPLEAVEMIKTLKPNLVFLDIQMPILDGFEVLRRIPNIDFEVVFQTANSHYAIEAFRFNAIDYLTKPVDDDELMKTIDRVEQRFQAKSNAENFVRLFQQIPEQTFFQQPFSKIAVPIKTMTIYLPLDDIIYIEGQQQHCTFYLNDRQEKIISIKSIGYYRELLEDKGFIDPNRSFLVNTKHVEAYLSKNDAFLLLKNQSKIRISKTRLESVLSTLGFVKE
jgi:two-component system, LytTR family, response regulator